MLFCILLSDPIGNGKHFAGAAISEDKADSSRPPLLAGATPGDALPLQIGGFEVLFLLRGFIKFNPLVFGQPIDILIDKRLQPFGRGYFEEDRSHLLRRFARNAFIGFLRLPGIRDFHRNGRLSSGTFTAPAEARLVSSREKTNAPAGATILVTALTRLIVFMYFSVDVRLAAGLRCLVLARFEGSIDKNQ
jgi:hypothetical protein